MTICWKCRKVLTDEQGNRLASANWDSTIRRPSEFENTDEITWALCDVDVERLRSGPVQA